MKPLLKCLLSVLLIIFYIAVAVYNIRLVIDISVAFVFYFTTANAIGILFVYVLVFICGWCYTESLISVWKKIWSSK